MRLLLSQLKLELEQLAIRLEEAEAPVQKTAQESEVCRRLDAIPSIRPTYGTALIAAVGNGAAFRKGREFAAWVGLVPREHSTGASKNYSVSASAETPIYDGCLYWVHEQSYSFERSSLPA